MSIQQRFCVDFMRILHAMEFHDARVFSGPKNQGTQGHALKQMSFTETHFTNMTIQKTKTQGIHVSQVFITYLH